MFLLRNIEICVPMFTILLLLMLFNCYWWLFRYFCLCLCHPTHRIRHIHTVICIICINLCIVTLVSMLPVNLFLIFFILAITWLFILLFNTLNFFKNGFYCYISVSVNVNFCVDVYVSVKYLVVAVLTIFICGISWFTLFWICIYYFFTSLWL